MKIANDAPVKEYIIDTLKKQVVGNREPHEGDAVYICVDSGNNVATFEDGKITTFGWNCEFVYSWLIDIHSELWNPITRPRPAHLELRNTPSGRIALLVRHANMHNVQIWEAQEQNLLLEVEDNQVIHCRNEMPFDALDAAVKLYRDMYR